MHLPIYAHVAQCPRRVRWFMTVAWILIAAKCLLVWWAVGRWAIPVHPLWIVGPTLAFAFLITGLWLTHRAG